MQMMRYHVTMAWYTGYRPTTEAISTEESFRTSKQGLAGEKSPKGPNAGNRLKHVKDSNAEENL
jgi:hypothetical protein